jgi:RNA polymerase sigma-70 factor (ECF subfamily)
MNAETQPGSAEFARYRNYLHVVARAHLDWRLRGNLDASDVVQETLVRACKRWEQCAANMNGQRLAWLRSILLNYLRDELRRLRLNGARLIQEAIDCSSARLEASLAAPGPSPSEVAQHQESSLQFAEAFARLPEAQREALELQKFEGCSLAEIAQRMGRSPVAVAGLLKRGLENLRELMNKPDGSET